MNYGTTVGPIPHVRQEASPTNSSDATCACGAPADGYDARRNEPVCEDCARLRCDGGHAIEKKLPEHILEATPDHVLEQGPVMAVYEYESKHIDIEHEERQCRVCEGETYHRVETDHYRSRTASVCSTCGETTVTLTDGGSNLYTCDTRGCGNWKEVVTPDGYVCHGCADELERQYEGEPETAKLLTDGGINQQLADDRADPRYLDIGQQPALVETRDSLVYLADVKLRDSGWLYYREWDGDNGLLPPHQVGRVKFVPTDRPDDLGGGRRVADEDLLRQALPDQEGSA